MLLGSGSTGTVGFATVGDAPYYSCYDPATGDIYVANSGPGNVTVLHGTRSVANISMPSAWFPAYDPADGYVYVTGFYTNSVTILNGTRVLATLRVGSEPYEALFDPADDYVYVMNSNGTTVTILSGSAVVATVGTGYGPVWAAYDPANSLVYVENQYDVNVTVLDGTSFVANVTVGGGPDAAVYDPADGYVYVEDYDSNNVSVLDGTAVLENVTVGGEPFSATYDPADGYVYDVDYQSNDLSVFNGTSLLATIDLGSSASPTFAVFDPATGYLYVMNSGAENVSVVQGSVLIGNVSLPGLNVQWTGEAFGFSSAPWYATYDPADSDLYVLNSAGWNVTLVGATYPVTFTESGLPSGSNWTVAVDGFNQSGNNSTSVTFYEGNGTHSCFVVGPTDYRAKRCAPTGTLRVAGSPVTIEVPFVVGATYNVTIWEVGLYPGGPWDVGPPWCAELGWVECTQYVGGITFTNLSPGQYRYLVPPITDYRLAFYSYNDPGNLYNVSRSTGTIDVPRSNLSAVVVFREVTYPVRFHERGLPAGKRWGVELDDLSFYLGYYEIGSGVATAPRGSVVFRLPDGAGGSDQDTILYTVTPPSGFFVAVNTTGEVGIYGGGVLVNVTFAPIVYPVSFQESGLASGNWSVRVGGRVGTAPAGSTITIDLPNGTYAGYRVGPEPGYSSKATPRPLDIRGASASVNVTFTPEHRHAVLYVPAPAQALCAISRGRLAGDGDS